MSHPRNDVTLTIGELGSASLGIGNIHEAIALTNEKANAA